MKRSTGEIPAVSTVYVWFIPSGYATSVPSSIVSPSMYQRSSNLDQISIFLSLAALKKLVLINHEYDMCLWL